LKVNTSQRDEKVKMPEKEKMQKTDTPPTEIAKNRHLPHQK
jgi:hypothetical protein